MANLKRLLPIIVAVVAVGILAVAAQPTTASHDTDIPRAKPASPAQLINPALLTGLYQGVVALERVVPGEFDADLPAPESDASLPDLGEIDLALLLSHDGSQISGHVELTSTLVFTAANVVDGRDVGPAVRGEFVGEELTLTSDVVTLFSAGRELERQFRLTGQMISEEENILGGEYRETIWGYGPQPLTVIGAFTLVGPQLALEADFVGGPATGPAPLAVIFSDLSHVNPTGWQWDFGDGVTSAERDPTHIYTQVGSYTVSLTVSNSTGSDTKEYPAYITVTTPGNGDERYPLYLPIIANERE